MRGWRTILWCSCAAIALRNVAGAQDDSRVSNDSLRFDVTRGVTLYVANDEATLTLKMSSLLKGNELAPRDSDTKKQKKDILKRIGMAMMMAPLLMQLLSLPATLASIKFSLLRSILMGKIALAVMLYNTLRNGQKSEVVVIQKPEYHEHYYHSYHQPEDDDEGWWG